VRDMLIPFYSAITPGMLDVAHLHAKVQLTQRGARVSAPRVYGCRTYGQRHL